MKDLASLGTSIQMLQVYLDNKDAKESKNAIQRYIVGQIKPYNEQIIKDIQLALIDKVKIEDVIPTIDTTIKSNSSVPLSSIDDGLNDFKYRIYIDKAKDYKLIINAYNAKGDLFSTSSINSSYWDNIDVYVPKYPDEDYLFCSICLDRVDTRLGQIDDFVKNYSKMAEKVNERIYNCMSKHFYNLSQQAYDLDKPKDYVDMIK